MPMKKHRPEQIVALLRQIEVELANGKSTPQACKEAEITVQTYYRWRKEFGGLKLDQAKRLKELERENAKLKRVVAELSLEKPVIPTAVLRRTEVASSRAMKLLRNEENSSAPGGSFFPRLLI